MSLSDADIALIEQSLPLVRENLTTASEKFYVNLFAIRPDMRELFRDDLEGQGMRFMAALSTIAERVGDAEAFEQYVAGLAKAHAQLGVRADHFAPMGSALLVTLGEALGAEFTEETQAAWRRAYDLVADEMEKAGGLA